MSLTGARVWIRPGSSWVDITSDVLVDQGITIARGRANEGSRVDPGELRLTLKNQDGRYSERNPLGPYFGQLRRNTPIRVDVNAGQPYLAINDTSGDRASTPDTGVLDVTGDIDLRIDLRQDDWRTGAVTTLLGKYDPNTNQRAYRFGLDTTDAPFITWSTTGADFIELVATSMLPVPPSRRIALRVTLDVNNGAAGKTATFYTAETIAGPWTQLGDPVTSAGVTSIFASTAPLDIGHVTNHGFRGPVGRILAAEVRNGIDGVIVASPDFTAQTVGATSFVDGAGRTWTLAGDATLSNRRTRIQAELTKLPSDSHLSGHNVRARVEAAGVLRRYRQSGAAFQSTLRRRVPSGDPLAYWPLEDGAATTSPGSPIAGVKPLVVSRFTFASDDTLSGSAALPTLGTPARLYGTVPGAAAGGWHAEMVYNLATMPTTEATMLRLYLSGAGSGVLAVRVRCSTLGIRVQALGESDAVIAQFLHTDAEAISDFTGAWNRLQLFSYDDGPDTYFTGGWRDIAANSFWRASTVFSGAPGRVTAVRGAWGSDFNGMGIGHLGIWGTGGSSVTAPGVTIYEGADDGFAGESALFRIGRVAGEAGIPISTFDGDLSIISERVGPQRPARVLELLESAADVDGGILYENRDGEELHYRDRSGLYNQTPALVLAYKGDGLTTPLTPAPDDQQTMNDVEVTREGGASGRVVIEEGPLSVQDPPNGVGPYEKPFTLNLFSDEQTEPHAGWLAHLGTWDEERFPSVSVKLTAAPHRITEAADIDVGDRLQITDPPLWLAPNTIDLVVQGYTETIYENQWDITYNCTPAGPWEVFVLGDTQRGRLDTSGSELASPVDADDTALLVATDSGRQPWITTASHPSHLPMYVQLGGEVVTVTAISGTTSPQTFTVTRSTNGVSKSHPAGTRLRLARAVISL